MYRTEIIKVKDPKEQEWLVVSADYFGDFGDVISGSVSWAKDGVADCDSTGEGDGWAETKNLKEAVDLGRYGWGKGRDQMLKVLDESNVIRRAIPHKSEALDVAGYYPVVPLACAGDPVCMITHGISSIKTKPVIKIVVNVAVSGAVTTATIMRRGGAILSWIDGLEDAGYRCEVDIIESGLFQKHAKVQKGVLFSLKAKSASEPVDVDRLAFLLCHPAMQRRVFFSLYERLRESTRIGLIQSEVVTYGSPTDLIPEDILGQHSIYFPALMRGSGDWDTPATAVAAVERMIQKSLQLSEVAEDLAEAAL